MERANADLKNETIAAGKRFAGLSVEPDYVALEMLAELVDAAKLKIHVDAAHAALDRSTKGKIVLTA